jgi:TetR/AcrR family transcriptional regulator, tetracycline repressor protein
MERAHRTTRSGLTRHVIVQRALLIGDAEGLEAVSVRRLATELGVTPMALYRHVKDKQDLVNAMYEAIVEGFDLKAGIRPSMKWTNQLRRSLMNVIALHERPVALPLAIAYSGNGSPSIWRLFEDGLDILLKAGFTRRQAVVLNRILSTLVAGYLTLFRQAPPPDPDELMLARKRFELVLLSLPRAGYPTVVDSARELVDAQFGQPQELLTEVVELMVAGVEALWEKKRGKPRARLSPAARKTQPAAADRGATGRSRTRRPVAS